MPMPMTTAPAAPPPADAKAVRHLGRFQLLRLLGKTRASMIWLVADPVLGQELMLVMPREKPASDELRARWLQAARRAARVEHPGLLAPVEVGEQENWTYLAYERQAGSLMSERLGNQGLPVVELVPGMVQALEGLAFAHEAGQVHRDLHAGMVLMPESGPYKILGLGVVEAAPATAAVPTAVRLEAERDMLGIGLLMHQALTGHAALDQPDLMLATERLAPLGSDVVRLPFTDIQAIADPLRAIVNRATDRQQRQRYRNARTLARALSGWLRASSDGNDGAMALLLDRMRVVGLLPAMPGGLQRARRLSLLHRERMDQLAEVLLEDVGLCFELLRAVNWASRRAGAAAHNGPILTVRRAIAMLGLDGVKRAAQALKAWPGPLGESQAGELERQLAMAIQAARVARWIRPPGYDGELAYLLAVMQRLGRLVVQYHFPDEALQIRRLMLSAQPAQRGAPEEPGMSEQSASFAVLGVDLDALTLAVGRHWGLDSAALHLMRRLPLDAPVHATDADAEMLRMTASCANEVVEAQQLPSYLRAAALAHVAQRYARVLDVTFDEIQQRAQGIAPQNDDDELPEDQAVADAKGVASGVDEGG